MPESVLLIILFLIFWSLPFIAALIELFLKRDAEPIPIDLNRKKEPDYFGNSFINLLTNALKKLHIHDMEKLNPVYLKLKLNKEEWLGFLDDEKFIEKKIDVPVVFTTNISFWQDHIFKKELVVFGNAVFFNNCVARALYVKGECFIGAPVRIARWVHVGRSIIVKSNADLGISVYAQEMKIRSSTTFKRAYAKKIDTTDELLIDKNSIPKSNVINLEGTLSITGSITIGGRERPVLVDGGIFSDSDVQIEGDVWIKGNVFSQKSITLKDGVVIGVEGKVKSVVARGEILIKGPFRIYGYLHSEKRVEISS